MCMDKIHDMYFYVRDTMVVTLGEMMDNKCLLHFWMLCCINDLGTDP